MISTERTNFRLRLCLPFAAAVVLTTLAGAMGAASAQSTTGTFTGFLLERGRYTTIDAPRPGVEVVPVGINNRGQIVGEYIVDDAKESGFIRDKRGRITTIDVPGARGTEAHKINNRGQIVGAYSEDTPLVDDSAKPRSFLLDRGELIRIDVPGAMLTVANGINERGQVVGFYVDAGGMPHGYLWEKGRFTTVDAPGPMPTAAIDINDRGQILGAYGPITGEVLHGFLMSGRVYTTINNRGQIVGLTLHAPGADLPGTRGFLLAQGVKGPFAPVAFPGAARTAAFDINDRGRIVGAYEKPTATPGPQPSPMPMPLMMPVR